MCRCETVRMSRNFYLELTCPFHVCRRLDAAKEVIRVIRKSSICKKSSQVRQGQGGSGYRLT